MTIQTRHQSQDDSSSEESASAPSETEYESGEEASAKEDASESPSKEEDEYNEEEAGSNEEEGTESGSYEDKGGGSQEGSYEEEGSQSGSYEDDGEAAQEGSHEEEGSQSGSYEDEGGASQEGSDEEERSQSGSYEEEGGGSQEGSHEEEGSGSGSYEEGGEASQEGSYEEEGSHSGNYEEEGEASQEGSYVEEGSQSGSYEEEEGEASQEASHEEEGSQSGSYEDEGGASQEGSDEEEGSQSGSYEEEGRGSQEGSHEDEGSGSGSYEEGIEGSQEGNHAEEGSQSGSYEEEGEGSQEGSYEEEGSQSGSYEDEGVASHNGTDQDEGSQSGSYEDEGEDSQEGSHENEGEASQEGSYDEEGSQSRSHEDNGEASQEGSDDDEGSHPDSDEKPAEIPREREASHSASDEEEGETSGSQPDVDEESSHCDEEDPPREWRASNEEEEELEIERASKADKGSYSQNEAGDISRSENSDSQSESETLVETEHTPMARGMRASAPQFMPGQDEPNSFSFDGMTTSRNSDPSFAIDSESGEAFDYFGTGKDGSSKAGKAQDEDGFFASANESAEPDLFKDAVNAFAESGFTDNAFTNPTSAANAFAENGFTDNSAQSAPARNNESNENSGSLPPRLLAELSKSQTGISFDDADVSGAARPPSLQQTDDSESKNGDEEDEGGQEMDDDSGFDGSYYSEEDASYMKPPDKARDHAGEDVADSHSNADTYTSSVESEKRFNPHNPTQVYTSATKELSLGAMVAADKLMDKSGHGSLRSIGSNRSSSSRLELAAKRALAKKEETGEEKEETKSPKRIRSITGYTREQMTKLAKVPRESIVSDDNDEVASLQSRSTDGKKKKKKRKSRKRRVRVKSEALLELAASVNAAMIELENEKEKCAATGESDKVDVDASPSHVLHSFEALAGILLRLSDELEVLSTFAKKTDAVAIDALKTVLSYTDFIEDIFSQVKPVLMEFLSKEVDEELEDFLYGMNLIVEQLAEICFRVGEKQQWNARANTSYLTLLELLSRDTLEVTCIYDDVDTPEYQISEEIQKAWEATGHDEEIQTLLLAEDLAVFRQICYEVMLSCDQWCPDTEALLDICAVEESEDDPEPPNTSDDDLVPPPEAALQVLEKINGEYLTRIPTLASILRRILPAEAVKDSRMKDCFAKIRSTIRNPLGLSPSTLVSITGIPEDPDDEEALGIAGVGKTTLAAVVANHPDVRRFFFDGIAWIHVGPTELNYARYVQCLQDIIGQLELPEDEEEPKFPALIHSPGESEAKRRRREEGFMIFVRQIMIEFVEGLNILIVLDDVCFDPDLDWFDFTPPPTIDPEDEEGSCVVLVTSRRRNLLPDADTVEVDMLEEHEAIKLLIKESGALSKTLIPESPEVKSVVVECANHALAVKSIGRSLNLKHATGGKVCSSVEEIHLDIVKSMDAILKNCAQDEADMMYEILNLSMSPDIGGQPTRIIKFCFATFVKVFCERKHISDFALADSTPIVPLAITEKLFKAVLNLEEETLKKEGGIFFELEKEPATLIPEALSALGVFKVVITFVDEEVEDDPEKKREESFVQIMHKIQQEYGEFLYEEDTALAELTKDGERRWNKAFAEAYLVQAVDWDTETPDAGLDYALEMLPSHMYRGGMLKEAANLLSNTSFIRGRLFALGRENGTRRHIKDCEALFDMMTVERSAGKKKKLRPNDVLINSYEALGGLLYMDEDELIAEEGSPEAVEVGRSRFDLGLSLAEHRCRESAIKHWEKSQELLVSALGLVELVAGVLYNVGVVYADMTEYEQALGSLKQCLKIRGAIHGEEHILYAQTIQKIGDVLLSMSDYHEAMESYNWALDVMHLEPNHHRIDIGDILENMGNIHYSKGEIDEALQSFQDALRSKQVDLGEDHPELATTFHHIGNCLSDQGKTEEAIAHFEEAIRLKNIDPDGGAERDADVLTIQGVLHNLHGRQQDGLECYERALQVLVTKVPHLKEKVASLLHLIGCVYLMSGEHKKSMKLFEESLQARRKVLGFVHLDVASTLFNMAFLHQSRNRLDKALKCLEEALKIRQLRLPDSEKVAVTHEKIGNLARAMGKTKKAEIAFGEALRIRKLVHGESHEAVATVLQELGDLMDDLGETDSAMKHYVQALEIRESRLGPDDISVAETYYSMGFTLQRNEASDRAIKCFEESLSIRKFQLGDDAKEVGDTLNMMGFLQAQRGELDDAISLLWESLRIRKLHGDLIKVSETLKNIGNVHREKQEFELSIECYEECLHIRRAELGDRDGKVAEALIAMGNVQSDMDATEQAMESYKEALTIRIRLYGEQDESVASVLQYMGTLEFRANRLDRAYQLLDEFVRIRQDNGTEPDGDYVNVLFMIGNVHKMQGHDAEAQKCWTEAYDVFQELGLADGNPQIAEVMGNLVQNDRSKDKRRPKRKTAGSSNGKSDKNSNADQDNGNKSASKSVFGRLKGKMKGVQGIRGKRELGHRL